MGIKRVKKLLVVLIVALIIRILLSPFYTYYNDLATFQLWSLDLIRYGFGEFYHVARADYHPGYLYVLWFVGKVYYWMVVHIPQLASLEFIYKSPSIFADLGSSIFIYKIALKYTSKNRAFITSLLFLFNPAFLINSTLWGQIDNFFIFFLISSVYFFLNGNFIIASLLLALSQSIKPIAILILPIYIIYLYTKKAGNTKIILFCLVFILTIILLFIPFNKNGDLLNFIINRYRIMSDWFAFATLNAFNLWAIVVVSQFGSLERIADETLLFKYPYEIWGKFLFIFSYILLLVNFYRKILHTKKQPILLLITVSLCYLLMFVFLTRMRERHLSYGLSLLILIIPILPIKKILIITPLYLVYILNLIYAFFLPGKNPLILSPLAITLLSLSNLGIVIYLLKVVIIEQELLKSSRHHS